MQAQDLEKQSYHCTLLSHRKIVWLRNCQS